MAELIERLRQQYGQDRALAEAVWAGTPADDPAAALVAHQRDDLGVAALADCRLPEHFRGPWEQARVCFLGPHVEWHPDRPTPRWAAADPDGYLDYCRELPAAGHPYSHYAAIMGGAPYLAAEVVHWPCEKERALDLLKGPAGPALVDAGLELTWALLRESPVQALVLTGNDALKQVLPRLGHSGTLPGVTQLHGEVIGDFPLPGASGRTVTVIASFHWSAEMPMFVRRVPGLGGMPVRSAISAARARVAGALAPILT